MNLPPFYIGQKVIALTSFNIYIKHGFNTPIEGETYTVRGLRLEDADSGKKWCVDLVEVSNEVRTFKGGIVGEVCWVGENFSGIEPLVTKMELTKVLEKIHEFVFTN
jgi:hypothetical protein